MNAVKVDIYELINRAQGGDKAACDEIIQANLGLVRSVVRKFLNRGAESEDLFQTGCIGLIKAVDKFDTGLNLQFSTYAVPMIMGEIKRFLRDDGMIKVSRNLKEISGKAAAVREMLLNKTGVEPGIREIADNVGVGADELVMALDAASAPLSLYSGDNDDDSLMLIDKIPQKEDGIDTVDRIVLNENLRALPPKHRQIIIMRYYQRKTQAEIAKMLGISQVQVSRIEKKILLSLKEKF